MALLLSARASTRPRPANSDYDFEAAGLIRRTNYFSSPPPGVAPTSPQTDFASFTVSVRNSNWLIHLVPGNEPTKYIEWNNDGLAEYVYGGDVSKDYYQGEIVAAGTLPVQGPTCFIPVLWLAFASSTHLDKNSKALVPPYLDSDRPVLEVEMVRRSDSVRLPESVSFFRPANESDAAPSLPSKPHLLENEDAHYRVLQFTNLDGMDLPLSFELTAFRKAAPSEDPDQRYPRTVWAAEIQSIKRCAHGKFIPELPTSNNLRITDHRLQLPRTTPSPDGLVFKTNRWPTLNDLTNHPDFARFMSMREFDLAHGGGVSVVSTRSSETVRWKGARKLDGTIAGPLVSVSSDASWVSGPASNALGLEQRTWVTDPTGGAVRVEIVKDASGKVAAKPPPGAEQHTSTRMHLGWISFDVRASRNAVVAVAACLVLMTIFVAAVLIRGRD